MFVKFKNVTQTDSKKDRKISETDTRFAQKYQCAMKFKNDSINGNVSLNISIYQKCQLTFINNSNLASTLAT